MRDLVAGQLPEDIDVLDTDKVSGAIVLNGPSLSGEHFQIYEIGKVFLESPAYAAKAAPAGVDLVAATSLYEALCETTWGPLLFVSPWARWAPKDTDHVLMKLGALVRYWPLYVACGNRFTTGSYVLGPIWEVPFGGFYGYVSEERLPPPDAYGARRMPPLEADLNGWMHRNAPALLDALRKRGIAG